MTNCMLSSNLGECQWELDLASRFSKQFGIFEQVAKIMKFKDCPSSDAKTEPCKIQTLNYFR